MDANWSEIVGIRGGWSCLPIQMGRKREKRLGIRCAALVSAATGKKRKLGSGAAAVNTRDGESSQLPR
ncbi:hypothetical protein E2562_028053 [Oryza meyeriana var. granulata]|uniref:Uncharacterized protein n=1 Tax=Oryza meyeriana var. granulata TaxID=110450 RepID=A0A6G1C0C7_9ORYZ|nr:hypothetical protein E2562_028053 [Oryza meyeriana var. granulata]